MTYLVSVFLIQLPPPLQGLVVEPADEVLKAGYDPGGGVDVPGGVVADASLVRVLRMHHHGHVLSRLGRRV